MPLVPARCSEAWLACRGCLSLRSLGAQTPLQLSRSRTLCRRKKMHARCACPACHLSGPVMQVLRVE
jgi:hypothetical protein